MTNDTRPIPTTEDAALWATYCERSKVAFAAWEDYDNEPSKERCDAYLRAWDDASAAFNLFCRQGETH